MECRDSGNGCRFRFPRHLDFTVKGADVSWWKGSVGIAVDYHVKNTSPDERDSIDYSRFSVVCSNGMELPQGRGQVRVHGVTTLASTVKSFAPGASLDTLFTFYTRKFSKKAAMQLFQHERFFLRYTDGNIDTLLSVVADDSRIR